MNPERKAPSPNERYTFIVRWLDVESSLNRGYILHCYCDDSIELIDMKTRKTFLRRVNCDGVKLSNIFVGGVVDIFSRRMDVIKYGDFFTQTTLESQAQRTFALVRNSYTDKAAYIFQSVLNSGCKITKMKMVQMTKDDAIYFCKEQEDTLNIARLVEELIDGPLIALELAGKNALAKWKELMDPNKSREPHALGTKNVRPRVGQELQNAIYGSNSTEGYEREMKLFFPPKNVPSNISPMSTATFKDCTLAIIKPHAVAEGIYPQIMLEIQNMRFTITAIQMYHMSRINAEEFFEIYRGVLPEFKEMIDHFVSGPCIGMEIVGFGSETATRFREAVGPRDPELAKLLRPSSLRAGFGRTVALNALHCTDLESDSISECEHFFSVFQA